MRSKVPFEANVREGGLEVMPFLERGCHGMPNGVVILMIEARSNLKEGGLGGHCRR